MHPTILKTLLNTELMHFLVWLCTTCTHPATYLFLMEHARYALVMIRPYK